MSHHGGRGYSLTKQMRIERRQEAEARQAKYDELTLEQKLARLPAEGCKKQRARLEVLLKQGSHKPGTTETQQGTMEEVKKKAYQKPSKQDRK